MTWNWIKAAPLLLLAGAAGPMKPIDLPNDRLFPESVSIGPDGMAYVGSATGGVLRVALRTGKVEAWIAPGAYGSASVFGVFADTRNGMLWTCDNDFSAGGVKVPGGDAGHWLKGFDLRTGAGRISLALPGAKPLCNDIAVARDGAVFVTDTSGPRILRWRPGAAALEVWVEDAALDDGPRPGGLDGIAFGGDGNLYVTNVRGGGIYRVTVKPDGAAGGITRLALSRPLASPDGMRSMGGMDFALAEGGGRIARMTVTGDRADIRTLAEGVSEPTGVDVRGKAIWYVQGHLASLFNPAKPLPATELPFRLTPVARD